MAIHIRRYRNNSSDRHGGILCNRGIQQGAVPHVLGPKCLHTLCTCAQYQISVFQRLNPLPHCRATFQVLGYRLNKPLGHINGVKGNLRKICTNTVNLPHDRSISKEGNQTPGNRKYHKKADCEETGLGEKATDGLFLVLNRTWKLTQLT